MNTIISVVFMLLAFSSCGKPDQNSGQLTPVKFEENELKIGKEWSRIHVDKKNLEQYSALEQKVFKSVANIHGILGSGTAFYLGQFSGEHLFATNHHVIPTSGYCSFFTMITLFDGSKVACKKLLSSWPDVEIAFFIVTVSKKTEKVLIATEPLKFEFNRHIRTREKLLSAGFGITKNPKKQLTYINDEFCVVTSRYKDYRKIDGPGALVSMVTNKEKKKTWSFMHGCEGSHGDSGSPLLSRYTGNILGVYWGGKTPKGIRFTNDEYVRKNIKKRKDKVIWNKFNMGVPSYAIFMKIKKYLKKNINHNPLKKGIFESLIN